MKSLLLKENSLFLIFPDLIWPAEDVGIILLKPSDSGQSGQRTRQLITM